MRRMLFRSLITVILSIMLLCVASAAENTYQILEMGLEMSIPSELYVVTRETPDNDPIFSAIGTTKTELIDLFVSSGIYLNAFPADSNEEIVVTMTEGIVEDFNLMSDVLLEVIASSFDELYAEQKVEVDSYSIYQHSQAKFVKLYYYDTVNTVWGLQYFTTYNTKAMNFTLRSYEGAITAEQEALMKTIVDGIRFDTAPVLPEPGEETMPFLFEDTDSGARFTVPANWVETELSKEREFLDVGFTATEEDGYCIYYGSTDIWGMLTEQEKAGYRRKDFNNSIVTKADVAESCGIAVDKVFFVNYNGVPYYRAEVPFEGELLGLPVSYTMVELIHISNGWMYLFQFGGSADDKYFSDFEALLKSVEYPGAVPQKTESLFLYTDHEADVSFTVPANWAEGMPYEEDDLIDVEFVSDDYPENLIVYWSSDIWEQQTDEEKAEYPRAEINNAYVTEADVAEMYDLTEAEVSRVTYNGAEYFKVVTCFVDKLGDGATYPIMQLVRFDNGWMYEFEFVGTIEDGGYDDFEELLGSVKYPAAANTVSQIEKETGTETGTEEAVVEEKASERSSGNAAVKTLVILLIVVAVVGIGLFAVGLSMEKRKHANELPLKTEQLPAFTCKVCGHSLPGDSQFCPYCGAKIRKKDRLL